MVEFIVIIGAGIIAVNLRKKIDNKRSKIVDKIYNKLGNEKYKLIKNEINEVTKITQNEYLMGLLLVLVTIYITYWYL